VLLLDKWQVVIWEEWGGLERVVFEELEAAIGKSWWLHSRTSSFNIGHKVVPRSIEYMSIEQSGFMPCINRGATPLVI